MPGANGDRAPAGEVAHAHDAAADDGARTRAGVLDQPPGAPDGGRRARSERRLEYTAIGDTCNTASRLEGMTKGTPHQVFISDATRGMLLHDLPDLVHVDTMEVRGKQAKIDVWSIAVSSAAR